MLDQLSEAVDAHGGVMRIAVYAIVLIAFGASAYYVFTEHVLPRLDPSYAANKEFVKKDPASDEDGPGATLIFFYTNWCPHCKTAKPIWEAVQQKLQTSKIEGHSVSTRAIDCEAEADIADSYGVKGYPTFILEVGDKKLTYEAAPTVGGLMDFVRSSLRTDGSA